MVGHRSFSANSVIFQEGDTGRSMYVILSGQVLMCRQGDSGHTVRLMRLRPGDFFGETTLIEIQPRPCRAVAETEVRLVELTNVDLYRLYRDDVNAYVMVLQNINRELCRRLRRADGRITEFADLAGDEATQIGRVIMKR